MITKDDEQYLDNPDYNMTFEKYILDQYYKENYRSHNTGDDTTTEMIYKSSNEFLQELFEKHVDVQGKRVAVVGSSGDQVINALFYGSKDITLIDANIWSQAFTEYKLAAIRTFDFYEFTKLFNSNALFTWNQYAKLSHLLSAEAKNFWDNIFLEHNAKLDFYNGKSVVIHIGDTILNEIFYEDHFTDVPHRRNKETYEKLRNILNNENYKINYVVAEFADFPDKLNGKYDLILLSNILDYISNDKFAKDTITSLYNEKLIDYGTIQAYYSLFNNGRSNSIIQSGMNSTVQAFYNLLFSDTSTHSAILKTIKELSKTSNPELIYANNSTLIRKQPTLMNTQNNEMTY